MFKILIISVITLILVIITFLILMSFLNIDIITHSNVIEKFNDVVVPIVEGGYTNYNKYCCIFNTSGKITFSSQTTCEVLIVGGGGGGGRNDGYEGGGGGGGGGVGHGIITFNSGTYEITIGVGGNGGGNSSAEKGIIENGNNGGDTTIKGIFINETAYGGGGGGYQDGLLGGSGGGSSGYGKTWNPGESRKGYSLSQNAFMHYYGNIGGKGNFLSGGAGGGGAESKGLDTTIKYNYKGADGGIGKLINIDGNNHYYGGGGGGGAGCHGGCPVNSAYPPGSGGEGGGGYGGFRNNPGNGKENTGGGGGGSSKGKGGNGGSGVVIIKYYEISDAIKNKFQTDLKELFKAKNPWGFYTADNFEGIYLKDISGNNNRNATLSGNINLAYKNGNGASSKIRYIYGGTSSYITWPSGSIPETFTILSLTRYNGVNKQRILTSDNSYNKDPNDNLLHGHWAGGRGRVYYRGWKTHWYNNIDGNNDDWLCCIGKNSDTKPYNILLNGIPYGLYNGGIGNSRLSINRSYYGEKSDWALSCVIIWDKHLTDDEMQLLNMMINWYKTSGKTIKEIIDNVNNNSVDTEGGATYSDDNEQLTQNDVFNKNNNYYYYDLMLDSRGNNKDIKSSINKFNGKGDYIVDSDGDGVKIILTTDKPFVLKKVVFKSNSSSLKKAPAEWTIKLDSVNTLSGSASIGDYEAFDGKSKNICVSFYINNEISSKTYEFTFKKTLGDTQLDFNAILLYNGTIPETITSNDLGVST